MGKLRFYLFVILVISLQIASAQSKSTIPFHLTEYNNLSIRAILNNSDTVQLMFHTAANAVTLTEVAIKKLKSIHFTENTDSIQSWGGQSNSSRLSKSNTLQIGDLIWTEVPIWENVNSGQFTDGKFGIDLFKGKVIEIDFDKSEIRLYKTVPRKVKKYQKVKLIEENDELFLEAICKTVSGTYSNKFLLHSGYAGALLFDDQFAKETRINESLNVIGEKKLTDSYGNVLISKQVVLPGYIIEGVTLTDVPAGFFDGALGRQKISVLGGDILKRFNMVIDAKREFIYLRPNSLMGTGYRKM
jgi:hypothetical protein